MTTSISRHMSTNEFFDRYATAILHTVNSVPSYKVCSQPDYTNCQIMTAKQMSHMCLENGGIVQDTQSFSFLIALFFGIVPIGVAISFVAIALFNYSLFKPTEDSCESDSDDDFDDEYEETTNDNNGEYHLSISHNTKASSKFYRRFPIDAAEDNLPEHDGTDARLNAIKALKKQYTIMDTPLGTIRMTYDWERECFVYWGNNMHVKYQILDVVARKLCTEFGCPTLYIDINKIYHEKRQELIDFVKKTEENEVKQLLKSEDDDIVVVGEPQPDVKNVFANFRSYNSRKKTVNNEPTFTNRMADVSSDPNSTDLFERHTINARVITKDGRKDIVIDQSNKYARIGTLADFEENERKRIIAEEEKKRVKYSINYKDFINKET